MALLTRQDVIVQLEALEQGTIAAQAVAAWAFDQFYAAEEGKIAFEPGYRRAIGAVLDDLMFGDQPDLIVSAADARQMIEHLVNAAPASEDDEADDEEADDADSE